MRQVAHQREHRFFALDFAGVDVGFDVHDRPAAVVGFARRVDHGAGEDDIGERASFARGA